MGQTPFVPPRRTPENADLYDRYVLGLIHSPPRQLGHPLTFALALVALVVIILLLVANGRF